MVEAGREPTEDPGLDPDVLEELEFWGGPGDVDPGDVDPGDVDPGDVDPGDVDPGDGEPEAEPEAEPRPESEPEPDAEPGRSESGALVLVATPIGNLADLSPRAEAALRSADVIYCEDTRHSRKLLSHAGISGVPLRSLHEHNEDGRTAEVVVAVSEGRTVALISDAGMPGISDPGGRVVAAVASAGLSVTVVPGPSAALAALVTSGLATDRFCFEGFLPRSGRERTERLAALAAEPRTSIIFEAPGRVAATLADLSAVCGGDRPVAVARELTKIHEEMWRGPLSGAEAWAGERPVRGEVVLVLGGADNEEPTVDDEVLIEALRRHLGGGERTRGAVDNIAGAYGVARRRVYRLALALKEGATPEPP
jgi:16S rRNA (cytidine1402-2'-O)-methyltransferase